MEDFYGTGIEIWAGFGLVSIIEKKIGPIMSNIWGQFFHVFMGKFFFLKNIADGENIFGIEWSQKKRFFS